MEGSGSLKCPECGEESLNHTVGGRTLNVCEGCGGIWFGPNQLRPILDMGPQTLDELMGLEPAEPHSARAHSTFCCPTCRMVLHRTPLKDALNVVVNTCYGCAGVYVEASALSELEAFAHQPGAAASAVFSAQARQLSDQLNRVSTELQQVSSLSQANARSIQALFGLTFLSWL